MAYIAFVRPACPLPDRQCTISDMSDLETPKPDILVVDDDPDVAMAARLLLRRVAGRVETERDAAQALARIEAERFDLVLLDMNLSTGRRDGRDGLGLLGALRTADPALSVVLMTAFGGVPLAVEAMKHGAADFVLKPWQNERLVATVLAAAKLTRSQRTMSRLSSENEALVAASDGGDDTMLGQSAPIQALFRLIGRAAPTNVNVLILGESGTGKELAARAIHRRSARAARPFVSIDLGAVAETLFESEIFGHKKGAFTNAMSDRPGRAVAASGGTLFLDEIGNLPLYLQRKLLTMIERSEVVPVGGDKPVPIDLRLVTATNLPAGELARDSVFRQDLLYRINTVEITLPPLRQRDGDIPILAEHFAALYARKYNVVRRRFPARTLAALEAYSWPGNVRELRHAIERATVLAAGDAFEPEDFPILQHPRRAEPEIPAGALKLDEMEKRAVAEALASHGGNVSRAAAALGLTRAALYRRMEKFGL